MIREKKDFGEQVDEKKYLTIPFQDYLSEDDSKLIHENSKNLPCNVYQIGIGKAIY